MNAFVSTLEGGLAEERAAIARLRAGDLAALEPLVRAHQLRATQAAYLVVHDRSLAEEVVQAAFLKAYERIGQFDRSRRFAPWFLTTVLHDAVKAARRRDRHLPLEALGDPGGAGWLVGREPTPEERWERAETTAEVRRALAALPAAQRAAVVARYYLGLSEAEAARALACPPGTLKWRLHAARERLRLLLRPNT
jgi:RNA polymerase sigma-70 factor (ECF subfamily)